jgi:hypothetical protein
MNVPRAANEQQHSFPDEVRVIVERYLRLADDALPGHIDGLYLVGSLALDDYKSGQSDIDFIAATPNRLVSGELETLQRIHATLQTEHPWPWFSGIYVTWTDLSANPVRASEVPFHLEGEFGASGGFDANPAVWLTLRKYPVALRGPASPSVWHDDAAMRRWTLDNLNSYWQGVVEQSRSIEGPGPGAVVAIDQALAWCVPGVARMHFTIATGDVTSKSGACRYVLSTLPERWHQVAREALTLRNGEPRQSGNRLSRRQDVLDFMQFVIDDANALHRGDDPVND